MDSTLHSSSTAWPLLSPIHTHMHARTCTQAWLGWLPGLLLLLAFFAITLCTSCMLAEVRSGTVRCTALSCIQLYVVACTA